MIDNTCVVYTNGSQECERVCALLEHMGSKYHEYQLNKHFTQRAFEAEFGEGAEYPQVAIGAIGKFFILTTTIYEFVIQVVSNVCQDSMKMMKL